MTINNQVKVVALLQGMSIMKQMGINRISVIRDALAIICHVVHQTLPHETQLRKIVFKAHKLVESFESVAFYHVLWGLNSTVCRMENEAYLLHLGSMRIKEGVIPFHHLPWDNHIKLYTLYTKKLILNSFHDATLNKEHMASTTGQVCCQLISLYLHASSYHMSQVIIHLKSTKMGLSKACGITPWLV